jgi:hypothetical protein
MKRVFKFIILIVMFILGSTYLICTFKGYLFFAKGYGDLDLLILEIIGNSILVGIVTYFRLNL